MSPTFFLRRSLLTVAVVFAAACESSPSSESEGADAAGGAPAEADASADAASAGPTWSEGVAAVVGRHCVKCHTAGAAAPFALDTYAGARDMAAAMAGAVEAGRMPPWMPDPDCRHYVNERLMPDEDKALLAAWAEAGAPEGTPGAVAVDPEPLRQTRSADLVGAPVDPYAPDPTRPDDYRCFEMDLDFPAETYVTGTNVVPEVLPIVHHVLLYVVSAERVADMRRMDAEDEGPGYTCFGGPRLGTVGPIAAWVPGYQPQAFPPETAYVIPAGSRLVMQVHYNTLSADSAPDRTAVHLWTTAETPARVLRSRPLADLQIVIPAGEPESTHVKEVINDSAKPFEILGVAPHMHTLGTKIRVEHVRPDESTACLVDIPAWDFNWQQNYGFLPGEAVIVPPGERLRLTCVYDNSPANQPVINGEQATPRDVTWGEGTLDEMCLAFINVVEPFVPGAGTCPGFEACQGSCLDPAGLDCYLDCVQPDQPCATCLIQKVFGEGGCGRTVCGAELVAAGPCLRTCIPQALTSGTLATACLHDTCPTEYGALGVCMAGAVEAGQCDGDLSACDIAH